VGEKCPEDMSIFHLFIDLLVLTQWVLPVALCHNESVQAQGAQMESRSMLQSSMGLSYDPII